MKDKEFLAEADKLKLEISPMSGEEISQMLEEIASFYSRDVDFAVQKMTKLIEPLMTIFVGGIVLFVLLALYMPVFNLGKVIKK